MNKLCPLCQKESKINQIFSKLNAYTNIGCLSATPDERNIPYTDILLGQCCNCGFVFNLNFDRTEIDKEYASTKYVVKKIIPGKMSNALHQVVDKLMEYLDRDSCYMEIGCGDGSLACQIALRVKQVYTVDPSVDSLSIQGINNIVHFNSFFSSDIIKKIEEKPKLVVMRHLLEHIEKPFELLKNIDCILDNNSYLYIELPNIENIVEHKRFFDIFNDHFGYYSKNTLANALNRLKFSLVDSVYFFDKQIMGFVFQKNNASSEMLPFSLYETSFDKLFEFNIQHLNKIIDKHTTIGLYGAGAHGNSILQFIKDKSKIVVCFDKDPHKINKYLLGSNIKIVFPDTNLLNSVESIIINASLYEEEIYKFLKENGFKGIIYKANQLGEL